MLKNAITNWVNIRRSNMPYEQVVRYAARLVYSPALADNEPAYEAFVQAMVNNPFRQSIQGFLRQAEALIGHTVPDKLSTLQVPVSVLVGEYDQLAPPYLSEQLAALLPRSSLRVLPGAHAGFVEHPALYAQTLLALLGPSIGDRDA